MEINILPRTLQNLDDLEKTTLLKIYHNQENIIEISGGTDCYKKAIDDLIEKNLITTKIEDDKIIIELTTQGFEICGSMMVNEIENKKEILNHKLNKIPKKLIAFIVNRILWRKKDILNKSMIEKSLQTLGLNQDIWYEKILLKNKKINESVENFYRILEDLDLIRNIKGERWSSKEIETYFKDKYKNTDDLNWFEEDSLKYYYFFFIYAQDQKNLIDFNGENEKYRSMFFNENAHSSNFYYNSIPTDSHSILKYMGLSEKRTISFLEDMKNENIVYERYYPLTELQFFSDEDRIFVISNINNYMGFIEKKFLIPVVKSLLN